MRIVGQLIVAALFWAGTAIANDGKSSKMVLKMDKEQVAVAQKSLASIKGIKSTQYDEKEGNFTIFYDKPTLGCCSRIHGALREAGVKYTLISNEEYPSCKGKHKEEHS
ncbi:MAG: hypothetical protein NZ580_03095 [Bacteroidia bacterium]|nr:hypothetical protein [Bacteroidia bacterium]MDW8235318.1 hypothetical protein [Bacteroidia bacterium]